MIVPIGWFAVGAWLSIGRIADAAVSWCGGTGVFVIMLALIAAAAGLGAWCVEKEDLANIRAEKRLADRPPQDGHPLTSYELAVITAIENGERREDLNENGGGQ